MGLHCGIDWATEHHDVAVVDGDGRVVVRDRALVGGDTDGLMAEVHEATAEIRARLAARPPEG